MLGTDGYLAEGSIESIFIVKNEILETENKSTPELINSVASLPLDETITSNNQKVIDRLDLLGRKINNHINFYIEIYDFRA